MLQMIIKTENSIDEMIVNEGEEVVVSNIEEVTDSPITVYLHSDIGMNQRNFRFCFA
jgi:hypothetical protein